MDFVTLIDLISKGGLVSALLVALIGGMKGWYIWRGSHDTLVKELQDRIDTMTVDRDYWRDQAVKALTTATKAVTIVEATKKQGE